MLLLVMWFTLLSNTTPMAAWAVKSTAFIIMIAPTALFLLRAAKLTIHPLRHKWERKYQASGRIGKNGMTVNNNKQVSNQICTKVSVLSSSPEAPARDTDSHDNIKHQLGKEDKEKCKEVEGTVTPVEKRKRTMTSSLCLETIGWHMNSKRSKKC